jgi:hypothetical protein
MYTVEDHPNDGYVVMRVEGVTVCIPYSSMWYPLMKIMTYWYAN